MEKRDCIYPDCLIKTDFGHACEHSCEWETEMWAEKLAVDLVAAGESEYGKKE